MIQPLRSVHRRAFVTLAVVLPAILLAGIEARHPGTSLTERSPALPATAYLVRESNALWTQHSIATKFYGRSDSPRDIYVVLRPMQPLNEPDLLLYWSANTPQGNSLPSASILIAPYAADEAFALPLEKEGAGNLILYSLAHQTVFDWARVEKLP
jgi:hypothetical protein